MKKALCIVLTITLCLNFYVSSFAVSASSAQESSTTIDTASDITKIDFLSDSCISYDSVVNGDILASVSDALSQVVFKVEAGGEVFTIGYVTGENGYSHQLMSEKIGDIIVSLNENVEIKERIKDFSGVSLQNLELTSVYVDANISQTENLISNTNIAAAVKGIYSVPASDTSYSVESDLSVGNPQVAPRATSTSITGSYHYLATVPGETYTYRMWHNQTDDTDSMCALAAAEPHSGDGNSRYRNGAGYKWYPTYVDVSFISGIRTGQNRTQLWYKYNQTQLNYLNIDSNEALEMEVLFYNNTDATDIANRGNTYQYHLSDEGDAWASNQPNAYLDTTFMDSSSVSFCVGESDTTELIADTWYFWWIDGAAGTTSYNYVNDGRFRVTAQRSYRLLFSGAWFVYAEEHEPILSLGLTGNQRWVQGTDAWEMGRTGDIWSFVASTDPVKIAGT